MKVYLTYFKDSGKYYSNGDYETKKEHLFEIFQEVRDMVKARTVPGMIEGYLPEFTLINAPDHYHHPRLIVGGECQ